MSIAPHALTSPLRLLWCLLILVLCCTAAGAQGTYYEIVARHSGKCLEVYAGSTDNGAGMVQWDCWGGANQQWHLVGTGDGFLRIIPRPSGKALDVAGGSYDNGAGIIQWDYFSGANQQWQLIDVGGGYYRIVARHSGKALDVAGGSYDNGAGIIQWDYVGGANQQWQLRPVTNISDQVGEWAAPAGWPFVPVHLHVLPNGKVLAWAGENVDNPAHRTDVWLWDPANGSFVEADNNTLDLFCSGHSFLPDGRLLVAGGHNHYTQGQPAGEPHTSVFDFRDNSWTQGPDMGAGRWYPTNTTLGTGEVVITSGVIDGYANLNDIPDVWQTGGPLRSLPNAPRRLSTYPWMHVAPGGRVFNSGPNQNTDYLDAYGNGAWLPVAGNTSVFSKFGFRGEGSSVMYAPGRVLIAGGGDPPTTSAEVIDLNQSLPEWRYVGAMYRARRQFDVTLLPDGTVLATGGTSYGGFNDPNGAVYAAEIWNPAAEQWSGPLASMGVPRLYHSVAALLPDGRVLSGGGGNGVGTDHPDVELYSPPYLFKGPRPTIDRVPGTVSHGERFFVATPDANISRVTLVGLSSVTHSYNQNQRFVDLTSSIERVGGGLYVDAPVDGNLCPPGHYMLFLLNDRGVPSKAEIVRVAARSVTFESYNYPGHYLRHQDGVANLTFTQSAPDLQDASYTIVPGLAGSGISFRSVNFPDRYLRHAWGRLRLNTYDGTDLFKADATFLPTEGLADRSLVSFESLNYRGAYLRHRNGEFWLDPFVEDQLYRSDATFGPALLPQR